MRCDIDQINIAKPLFVQIIQQLVDRVIREKGQRREPVRSVIVPEHPYLLAAILEFAHQQCRNVRTRVQNHRVHRVHAFGKSGIVPRTVVDRANLHVECSGDVLQRQILRLVVP
ncbi:hypothetical protein SDC9_173596 [bioreactor metagenome]|uniref:Uncharacterized protein n=1 Tax=bioreactor metagenome TaxID=1076179 RepID=A0A645GJX5_9ZZZZ